MSNAVQHFQYNKLKACLSKGANVYLVGPAGSGKSHSASLIAEELGKKFYLLSVGPQTTQSHILGYMNATGSYVRTVFREAFENGGVFLFDEIDAGNPAVLTSMNAALANSAIAFPDGMVKKHSEFICIAAGNTYGSGGNSQYIGRNKLDDASIDRFVMLEWPYDENLEKTFVDNKEWLIIIHKLRNVIDNMKLKVVVSARAIINGSKLIESDEFDADEILEMTVFKGKVDEHTKKKVMENLKSSLKNDNNIDINSVQNFLRKKKKMDLSDDERERRMGMGKRLSLYRKYKNMDKNPIKVKNICFDMDETIETVEQTLRKIYEEEGDRE